MPARRQVSHALAAPTAGVFHVAAGPCPFAFPGAHAAWSTSEARYSRRASTMSVLALRARFYKSSCCCVSDGGRSWSVASRMKRSNWGTVKLTVPRRGA
jgi:hypothetical protein